MLRLAAHRAGTVRTAHARNGALSRTRGRYARDDHFARTFVGMCHDLYWFRLIILVIKQYVICCSAGAQAWDCERDRL